MRSPVTWVSCLPHFSRHGQSFPEDVRRKTKSQWALAQLPAGSPVAKFYVALLRDAEGDIRRKKKEDDALTALARGKVETAVHALRYHLEFVSRLLAEQLGATPTFRADGNYDLGELLPPVHAFGHCMAWRLTPRSPGEKRNSRLWSRAARQPLATRMPQ